MPQHAAGAQLSQVQASVLVFVQRVEGFFAHGVGEAKLPIKRRSQKLSVGKVLKILAALVRVPITEHTLYLPTIHVLVELALIPGDSKLSLHFRH
eukprot:Skav231482  [mRNA]  locus=scaffold820:16788:24524:- [translate_table: standard]